VDHDAARSRESRQKGLGLSRAHGGIIGRDLNAQGKSAVEEFREDNQIAGLNISGIQHGFHGRKIRLAVLPYQVHLQKVCTHHL
jgi:hypothetical protein